jgi:hypothetical protein
MENQYNHPTQPNRPSGTSQSGEPGYSGSGGNVNVPVRKKDRIGEIGEAFARAIGIPFLFTIMATGLVMSFVSSAPGTSRYREKPAVSQEDNTETRRDVVGSGETLGSSVEE